MEVRMAKCWELRGCDDEMQSTCPHHIEFFDRCPTKCAFAKCDKDSYEMTTDPELLFDPAPDRDQVIKEECLHCGFFLRNGPKREG